jgi:hypothetical protein
MVLFFCDPQRGSLRCSPYAPRFAARLDEHLLLGSLADVAELEKERARLGALGMDVEQLNQVETLGIMISRSS